MNRWSNLGEKIVVRRFIRWELGAESGGEQASDENES